VTTLQICTLAIPAVFLALLLLADKIFDAILWWATRKERKALRQAQRLYDETKRAADDFERILELDEL
jgi:hypothetical protein